jgi:hypothetical protein
MPKRISSKLKDTNQIAAAVVAVSLSDDVPTERSVLSKVMAEMGRRGGKIGGKRRLETMTAPERKKAASKAAKARWKVKAAH